MDEDLAEPDRNALVAEVKRLLHASWTSRLKLDRASLPSTGGQTEDDAMNSNVSEFPKHPLPQVTPPNEPQRPHVQPPTVFVYERQGWEYKVVSRSANQLPLSQDELNVLGKDGWELVGVVPLPQAVQFYLKRIRR